jgi:hypothetical protein
MGLINRLDLFKNESGRLGVGGHVFEFIVLALGISYGDDICREREQC